MDNSIIFAVVSLVVAHVSTDIPSDMHFEKNLILTSNCMVYFTPMEAKYTHLV